MYGDCADCKRLWDEHSDATKAHIALAGKTEVAQIQGDSAVLQELIPLMLAAAERRVNARKAFKEHEASHQDGKSDNGVDDRQRELERLREVVQHTQTLYKNAKAEFDLALE